MGAGLTCLIPRQSVAGLKGNDCLLPSSGIGNLSRLCRWFLSVDSTGRLIGWLSLVGTLVKRSWPQ